MKKRMKIISLLDKYSVRDCVISVTIIGERTGMVLFEGKLFEVPYKFCIDYVLSYKFYADHLEIVETLRAFE